MLGGYVRKLTIVSGLSGKGVRFGSLSNASDSKQPEDKKAGNSPQKKILKPVPASPVLILPTSRATKKTAPPPVWDPDSGTWKESTENTSHVMLNHSIEMGELSYDLSEKSITKKLYLECPARFSIQQNQYEEQDWITSDLHRKNMRRDLHHKVAQKYSNFCHTLRNVVRVPALYCKLPPDGDLEHLGVPMASGGVSVTVQGTRMGTVAWDPFLFRWKSSHSARCEDLEVPFDPRIAPAHILYTWLKDNHLHQKKVWRRSDGLPPTGGTPRTQCWDPTILARRSTAQIWDARLSMLPGLKGPSDYMIKGEKMPPRRKTRLSPEQSRSQLLCQPEFELASTPRSTRNHHLQITGQPSPRRCTGIGSEMTGRSRQPPPATGEHETDVSPLRRTWRGSGLERGDGGEGVAGVLRKPSSSKTLSSTLAPPVTGVSMTGCATATPRTGKSEARRFQLVESWDVSDLELHRHTEANL